jgi:hypothetical protein
MANDTLFVWDGIMEATSSTKDPGDFDVKWSGTLFANPNSPDAKTVGEPKRGAFSEFCDSDKQFSVVGLASALDGTKDDNKFKPYNIKFAEGEGWDMDGAKHKDEEHQIYIERLLWKGGGDKRHTLAYACGKDEFGRFIATGWTVRHENVCYNDSIHWQAYLRNSNPAFVFFISFYHQRPGCRLTLARRHVNDSDPRAQWDLETLRTKVLEAIYDEANDEIVMPPWQCDIFNAEYSSNQ